MSRGFRAVFSAFLLVCLGACTEEVTRPRVPRGVDRGGLDVVATPETPTIRPSGGPRSHEPGARPSDRVLLEAPPPAAPIVVTERQERPGTEVVRARDYSAELRALVGDPSPCLSEDDRALGRSISFQIEVDVQSSGRVVGARVTGPGVSGEALGCISAAVREGRFEAFSDGTRRVQTPVVLRLSATD